MAGSEVGNKQVIFKGYRWNSERDWHGTQIFK